MTEITAKNGRRAIYVIDPVAFFLALVGAPLSVAAAGFWIMAIPVFAVIMGGPFYLAIGVPVLLWHLGRNPPDPLRIAILALISFAVPAALALLYVLAMFGPGDAQGYLVLAGFGAFFAPVWGGIFGIFYRNFRRDIYKRPI